jgi:hypothetical protein
MPFNSMIGYLGYRNRSKHSNLVIDHSADLLHLAMRPSHQVAEWFSLSALTVLHSSLMDWLPYTFFLFSETRSAQKYLRENQNSHFKHLQRRSYPDSI